MIIEPVIERRSQLMAQVVIDLRKGALISMRAAIVEKVLLP